jgi:predicted P-loop ATPase
MTPAAAPDVRVKPTTAREWAEFYLSLNLSPVPLLPNKKECRDANWLKTTYTPEGFTEGDNLGIRSINGLVVVDVDSPEAVACAARFLPPSGAIYGRASKPRSKHLYLSEFEKTIALKDTDAGDTLIEIRSQHQDMAPPSVHPSGERVEWATDTIVPTTIDRALLLRAVRLIATCALVSRNYQAPGARHEWMLALAGVLKSVELTEPEAVSVVKGAAAWANDPKIDDRLTELHSTYTRSDDEPTAGASKLVELMDRGKPFVRSLHRIWGSTGGFVTDDKGKILARSQENIRRALAKLDITLSYDRFADRVYLNRDTAQEERLDDAAIRRLWLETDRKFGFLPAKDFYVDVLLDAARQRSFHPVFDYLKSLKWDGTSRLETWLIEAAKAGDSAYTRAVSRILLCAAVRRIVDPGCKFDEMVVLESGTQGYFKSSALRALMHDEAWFSDDLPLNVGAKEIVERTTGKWLVEASDLAGMRESDVEHLKSTLSRQVDGPVRLAYDRVSTEKKRAFVVVGTTNSYAYLKDSTGNRRFWPIRVDKINLVWIVKHRDQLWAEAYHNVVNERVSIRLPHELYEQAEVQQNRRVEADPWEGPIRIQTDSQEYQRLGMDEIWMWLAIPTSQQTRKAASRVSAVMQALGFRRQTIRLAVKDQGTRVVNGWARGTKAVQAALPGVSEDEPQDGGRDDL